RVPRARQRRAVAEGHRPRPGLATRRARPMNPILEAIRALQSEPTRDYATIRQRCEDVRKLLTSEAAAGGPTAETGGNARLSELLERIWSPGPSWFLDSPALADELLAACVESLCPRRLSATEEAIVAACRGKIRTGFQISRAVDRSHDYVR